MPRISHLAAAIAAAFSALPTTGLANPSGGVALHGQAVISNPAPKQLLVTTQNGAGGNHSAINWQSFSIGAGESTRFAQPSAASTSINRVVTNTPSAIFGTLSSNGKLVLVNQSGIAVGLGATIDTAGFTASVLGMSEQDAKAGRLRFSLDSLAGQAGPLTVQGNIIARNGDVVLIAPSVELAQTAVVQAEGGSAILVAGQSVEVTGRGLEGISMVLQAPTDQAINLGTLKGDAVGIFAGTLKHSGLIQANQVTVEGGKVVLKASGDAYVQGQGRIEATGGTKGGSVDVLGQRVAIMDQASIDASGATGGGSIRIGGDFQGKNPDVPNANVTYVGANTNLKADALNNGDGGKVIVWADDTTRAYGSITARGGATGGDGGFVEVSGKRYLDFVARVDTSAPAGKTGTLLLDPMDVNLVTGASNYPFGDDTSGGAGAFDGLNPNVFKATTGNISNLSWLTVNAALAINNVQITTSSPSAIGGNVGNITVVNSHTYSSPNSLTLLAHNNVDINAPITNTSSGAISAYAGWNGVLPGAGAVTTIAGIGDVNVGIFGAISHVGDLNLVAGKNLNVFSSITSTGGNQLFRAGGDIGFVNNSTLGGAMVVDSLNGSQTIDATGTIQLQAGTTFGGSVTVKAGSGGQSISANRLQINGGAGNGKFAFLRTGDGTLNGGGNQTVTVGSGGISMTGGSGSLTDSDNYAGLAQYGLAGTSQTITVNGTGSIVLQGGSTGKIGVGVGERGSFAGIDSRGGSQFINFTSGGTISLTGGSVGSNALAGIFAQTGTQTIQGATSIILTGGTGAGSYIPDEPNAAAIVAELGNQTISADTILLRGGASGTANPAGIHAEGTGALQTITANKIDVLGGAGGGGYDLGNFASIQSRGSQVVNVGSGGLTVTGGGGARTDNFARVEQLSTSGAQAINVGGGGSIYVTGGSSTGKEDPSNLGVLVGVGHGSRAMINASGTSQIVDFVTGAWTQGLLRLTGGSAGQRNYAILINNQGSQTITGSPSIAMTGGAAGGVLDEGNGAYLFSYVGNQNITASSLTLTGGLGGIENLAQIRQGQSAPINTGTAAQQTITVIGGGTVSLQGGGGTRNLAQIRAVGTAQTLAFSAGGLLELKGGNGDRGNFSRLRAENGTQNITGSPNITLTGGATGGLDNDGNFAQISADVGAQSIVASGIQLQGGAAGIDNFAQIRALLANQNITVGSGGLSLTGGGGSVTDNDNFAGVYQANTAAGTQTVTVSGGGAITLQGGSSAGTNVGLDNGSLAFITAEGSGGQLITFTAAGSHIGITGGTVGSYNHAGIHARTGPQTIKGTSLGIAPTITLTGGASGGVLDEGNSAQITARDGTQTIEAGATALQGGVSVGPASVDNAAFINAPTQNLTFTGNLALIGGSNGSANGGVRIGGSGGTVTPSNTNLNLSVTGNLTLVAGGTSGVAVGSTSLSTGLTNVIAITTSGNVTLNPSATQGVRIGSPSTDPQTGSISVTAGGNIVMNSVGGTGLAVIRSLGNVSLSAINSGRSITEAADGIIIANLLTVTADSGISLDSPSNQVTSLNATNATSGDIRFTDTAGTLLTVTGISQASSSNVRITADDLDITGPVSALSGTVTLRPASLARNTMIEASPISGVLSLSPADLQNVTTGVLELGRLDGTGSVFLKASLANSNVNAGTLRLLAANDVNSQNGAVIGSVGAEFNHNLELRANNSVLLTNGNVFLANNRSLAVVADNDLSLAGSVNIGAVTLKVGTGVGNTSGNMAFEGRDINVATSGSGSGLIEVLGAGNQSFIANGGDVSFWNNNTTSGILQVLAGSGVQTIKTTTALAGTALTGTVSLRAGTGTNTDVNVRTGLGNQSVNANRVDVLGGASGSSNNSDLDGGGSQTLTVGTGGLHVVGGANGSFNEAQLTQQGAGGSQTIVVTGDGSGANAITVTGGNGSGGENSALIHANGSLGQTITFNSANGIALQGGSGGFNNWAKIQSANGNQVINGAYGISLAAGAFGGIPGAGNLNRGNSATVFSGGGGSVGNQSINVGAGGLTLTGGGGTGLDQDNAAFLTHRGGAGTTQSITVSGLGNIVLQGGSSAKLNVGGTGHGSRALIDGGANQTITLNGGDLTLTGGTIGSRNYAGILADDASDAFVGTQTITGARDIILRGGATGGILGEGNRATIQGMTSQTISATRDIRLTGGDGGTHNYARILMYEDAAAGSSAVNQSVSATNGIWVTGGLTGGGFDSGNFANIQSEGIQTVNVGAGGLTIKGGGGSLTDNYAVVQQLSLAGTQTINLGGGGAIVMDGGDSLATTVGSGHGSRAMINANGTTQLIAFSSGGSIQLKGGGAGQRNYAIIASNEGDQTISGSPSMMLTGGDAGGVIGEGNGAYVSADKGTQDITASSITLKGGLSGVENLAHIRQGIKEGTSTLGMAAQQSITITGGGTLSIEGGGGATNLARVQSFGTDQTIDFSAGGSLTLTGGTGVSLNYARVQAVNGDQFIFGAPGISVVGGASGGTTGGTPNNGGNFAEIIANGGTQYIDASTITLTGSPSLLSTNVENAASIIAGGTQIISTTGDMTLTAGLAGTSQYAIVVAPTQFIDIGGNLTLTGGGSATGVNGGGGARIGGGLLSAPVPTNLTLDVALDMTLNGGSVSGSGIGSNFNGLQDTNIDLTVGGNLTLNAGAAGTRIGSPLGLEAGGTISILAGGNISLTGALANTTSIRTLGDVSLDANQLFLNNTVAGNTIHAHSLSGVTLGGAASLVASATTGTSLEVIAGTGAFVNSAGAGALSVEPGARGLVWSNNPALDTKGLTYDFKQYNAVYGVDAPAQATGNGFIYSIAPTPAVALAGPVSKVYDGTNIATLGAANYTATGIDGDILVLNNPTVGSYDTKNVGVGKTVTVNGVALAGATSSVADGSVAVYGYQPLASSTLTGNVGDISQASLTLSTSAVTKTYDGTLSALGTAVVSGGTLFSGDTLTGGTFAFLDKNAGTGKTVTAGGVTVGDGVNNANYSVSYVGNTASSISQAGLTLSTSAVTKTYDGTLSALGTAVVTGGTLFSGDTLSGGSFAFLDKNAGTGKTVTSGGVTVGDGVNNANYSISYVDNIASSINQAGLTLSTSAVSRAYDGTTTAAGTAIVTSGTVFGGDSLSGGAFTFNNKNVGTGKTVTTSGVTVGDGVNNGNYLVSYLDNTTSDISRANLTLSTFDVSKTYDGSLSALGTAKVVGGTLFAGDSLSGGAYSFTDKNVGTGKTVTAAGVTVSDGNGGGNYAVSYNNNSTSTITQRVLSTWTGSAGDGLWSTPGNWDAIPDLANVQAVSIPASKGTVQYNLTGTNLESINVGAGSALAVTGGTLNVSSVLTTASYSQSGGSYGGAGDVTVNGSFAMTGGTLSVVGNVGISHIGDMLVQGAVIESTGGNVNVASTGVLSVIGGALPAAIRAATTMDLTVAGLSLTGTSTSASLISGNSMTINSSGPVVLTGGAGATAFALIDPTVSGDINISSTALTLQGGSGAGAYASILNPKGDIIMSVLSPPTLVSGFGGVGATATVVGNNINLASAPIVSNSVVTDAVVTFLEQFEVAVAEQAAEEEKRDAVAPSDIVVEGQVCK